MGLQNEHSIFTQMAWNLSRKIPDGDEYFFRCTLLPWWGAAVHQHVLSNLSKTLITIANETATSLANIQESLDTQAKVVLGNWVALNYILAEQEEVCMTINSSGCTYIETLAQEEINITKIRQHTPWLQQKLGRRTPLFEETGDWFVSLFPCISQELKIMLGGIEFRFNHSFIYNACFYCFEAFLTCFSHTRKIIST